MAWNLRSFLAFVDHTCQLDPPERQGQLGGDAIENRPEINRERPVVSEQHPFSTRLRVRRARAGPDRRFWRGRRRSRRRRGEPPADRSGASGAVTLTAAPTSSGHVAATTSSPVRLGVGHHAADDPGRPDRHDGVDARVPHVRALGGRDEALREASQRLLTASVDRLGPRQAGQAEHHQHEDHRRDAGEDAGVLRDAHDVAPYE